MALAADREFDFYMSEFMRRRADILAASRIGFSVGSSMLNILSQSEELFPCLEKSGTQVSGESAKQEEF